MVNCLAIDVCTEYCSLAIEFNGTRYSRLHHVGQGHSQVVLPLLEELLNEANIRPEQLDVIGGSVGPGSFTGSRLNCALLQSLAFAWNKPVIGVSSLRTIAQGLALTATAKPLLVMLDARMDQVYWGVYCRNAAGVAACLVSDSLSDPQELPTQLQTYPELTLLGSGADRYHEMWLSSQPGWQWLPGYYPTALAQLDLLQHDYAKGIALTDPAKLQPVYLRDQVTQSSPNRS